MKDIEGIVEEFTTKYWKEWTDWDSVEFDKVTDWLRTTLQSQADKYEKHEQEMYESLDKEYQIQLKHQAEQYEREKTVTYINDGHPYGNPEAVYGSKGRVDLSE